jgi:hypothetical protein
MGADPNVDFGSGIRFSLKNFGCRVGGTATEGVQSVVKGVEIGEAKVGQLYLKIGIQKQIFCLKSIKFKISLLIGLSSNPSNYNPV